MSSAACIFCKIVKGEIPCFKVGCHRCSPCARSAATNTHVRARPQLVETPKILAFLDIQPLSKGHAVSLPAPSPAAAAT
jgi:diadenosine tetraphosphate (Ap4A) HIT family hydrolase